MRKPLAHLVCQGLFVVMTGALIAGCQKTGESAGPPPPTTVRHDLPELVKRFPPLGTPVSASWVSWGDDAAGAPAEWNVEYVDAVVQLDPLSANALVTLTKPTATDRAPSVQQILRSAVPGGPFLSGDGLDMAFSSPDASTYAYLDRGRNTLVLQSTGITG